MSRYTKNCTGCMYRAERGRGRYNNTALRVLVPGTRCTTFPEIRKEEATLQ